MSNKKPLKIIYKFKSSPERLDLGLKLLAEDFKKGFKKINKLTTKQLGGCLLKKDDEKRIAGNSEGDS